jgi:hypothetical protein
MNGKAVARKWGVGGKLILLDLTSVVPTVVDGTDKAVRTLIMALQDLGVEVQYS